MEKISLTVSLPLKNTSEIKKFVSVLIFVKSTKLLLSLEEMTQIALKKVHKVLCS